MRGGVVLFVPVLEPMTSLEDKAETPETTVYSIEDAADSGAAFRVESLDLDDAEDVGTDAFPQYGDWLPCQELRDGASIGEVHVETPRGLAQVLVENEVETGDVFAVDTAQKSPAGEWKVTVHVRD